MDSRLDNTAEAELDNMGAIYSISSNAFRTVGVPLLMCASVGVGIVHGESITGVVYSNTLGNGIHPAGRIELEVGHDIVNLEYGEPLERHYSDPMCRDIGAIWTVAVERVDKSLIIESVTCDGKFDENAHRPWLLVRDYLKSLSVSVSSETSLSPQYRSSPGFRRFDKQVNSHDLNFYFENNELEKCLRIVTIDPSGVTKVGADCAVELGNKRVGLLFDIVRSQREGTWEINNIQIE